MTWGLRPNQRGTVTTMNLLGLCRQKVREGCWRSLYGSDSRVIIRLADGEERSIQHIVATVFYNPDGSTMSATECVEKLYGELPKLFRNEDQLRALWSAPNTRKNLLEGLREAGYENNYMDEITRLVDAVDSD